MKEFIQLYIELCKKHGFCIRHCIFCDGIYVDKLFEEDINPCHCEKEKKK